MMREENLIPQNKKYIEKWRELVLRNREQGRDFEVLYDFLNLKREMSSYDLIFNELEKRVNERVRAFRERNY